MKLRMELCKCCLSAALLLGAVMRINADIFVEIDLGASWIGYMNVFELPANGGGYLWGSSWGTADLNASFSGPVLTLTPNTSIDRDVPTDPYWWQSGGTGPGNKTMDANMYVQNDSLAGQNVTFTGLVLNNTLVSPYTSTVFIKDFVSDYSSFTSSTTPVVPGAFSINLATAAGHHIQYGFETIGPNARLAEVAGLGLAQITTIPEPSTAGLVIGGILCLIFGKRRNTRP